MRPGIPLLLTVSLACAADPAAPDSASEASTTTTTATTTALPTTSDGSSSGDESPDVTTTTGAADMGPEQPPAVDYLIIAADPLDGVAQIIKQSHEGDGHLVVSTKMSDIVAMDSDPEAAVEAIRAHVRGYWQVRNPDRPMFLLLVGDTDEHAPIDGATIPASIYQYTLDASPEAQIVPTDHRYADMDDDDLPDLAVGRLPFTSPAEVNLYHLKRQQQATSGPHVADRRINLFAGSYGLGPIVDGLIETLVDRVLDELSYDFDITMTYGLQESPYVYVPEQFSDQVYARINEGPLLVSYLGHGSANSFDYLEWNNGYHPLLDLDDVNKLNLSDRGPILALIACAMGAFDLGTSVSEALLARPDGPSAVLSSTRDSAVYPNTLFIREVGLAITAGRAATVGEAFMRAKRQMIEHQDPLRGQIDDAFGLGTTPADLATLRVSHQYLYTLFGDPAQPIRLPQPATVRVTPTEASPGDALTVDVELPQLRGGTATITLESVRSKLVHPVSPVPPDDDPSRDAVIAANYAAANDKRVVSLAVQVVDGAASVVLDTPGDVPPGHYHVKVYAEDGAASAFGSLPVRIE